MPISLTYNTPKITTYSIKGKDLKELWASILKKGPVDPNDRKNVAFLTTTVLTFDPDRATFTGDGRITVERRTGWYEARCKLKAMKVELTTTIEAPGPRVKGLSMKAIKEWVRFYAKAMAHESEHVKKAVAESNSIVSELNALRGVGLGETEVDARNFAIDDLKTQMYDNYISSMNDRLNDIHSAFDKSTKHGEKKGAKLDTSIT